jgi:hypothetical protein
MRNKERVVFDEFGRIVPTPARDLDLRDPREIPIPTVSSEELIRGADLLRKTWGSMSRKSV